MPNTLSSEVAISRRFLRSVRVDADYGRLDALDGFVLQPSSRIALDILAKHINETQQRAFTWTGPFGGGKSSLALALASLVHPDKRIQQAARSVLGIHRGDPVARAFDASPGEGWTVIPIVGKRANIEDELAQALDKVPYRRRSDRSRRKRDVIAELINLAESPKRRGVLLIIDELGKFLEHSAASGSDIYFYQEIAEAACRIHGKLVIVGILHQAFEQYATRLGRDARDEWAKVQGRYIDISLAGGTDETLELIGRAIDAQGSRHTETKAVSHQVAASISRVRRATPDDLEVRLDRCWPLHPITAVLLGPGSKRKFGQNERSVFGFLNSIEPKGFRQFLESTIHTQYAYYYPWDFWDYLRFNLETAILASPDGHRWALGVEAVERAEARVDEMQLRLVKTVALIELFRNGSGLIADDDVMASCFSEVARSKVIKALKDLSSKSIVIFRKHLNAWGIYAGSDFDIDNAIAKSRSELGDIDVAAITRLGGLAPVLAKRLYQQYGAMRFLSRRIVNADHAKEYAGKFTPGAGCCGELLLILPGKQLSPKHLSGLAAKCSQAANGELVVGVPREAARIVETATELSALEYVREHSTELESDRVANREIEARVEAFRTELEELLRDSFMSASWFWNGELFDRHERMPLSAVASTVAEALYPKSPVLQSELINRDQPASNSVKARRDLMYRMLSHASQENLGYEKYPADAGMYFSILKSTTCHRMDGDRWAFAKPIAVENGTQLLPLWVTTDSKMLQPGAQVSLDELFRGWNDRPYGLKAGVMPILALAYYLANRNALALYHDGIFIPELSEVHVDEWLQDPSRISWRYVQIRKGEQRFLDSLSSTLTLTLSRSVAADPLSVARALVSLVLDLPEWTKRTSRVSKRSSVILNSLLRASDPHRVLFVDLPALLEFSDLEDVVAAIIASIRELTGAYNATLRSVETQMFDALDHHSNCEALQSRARTVSGISGDFRLDAFALRLAEYTGTVNDLESLISLAANKPSREWTDRDIEAALIQLGAWGMEFRRVEVLAPMKNRPATRKAFAVVFGQGDGGKTTSTTIDVALDDQAAIDAQIKSLRTQRPKDSHGRRLFLAALVEIGAEIVSEQNLRK